jgi:hypothetical protein
MGFSLKPARRGITQETRMHHADIRPNPFTMMTDPQAIVQALEGSERLKRLQRRVCRPLDRPLIPKVNAAALAYDQEVDLAADEDENEGA